MKLVELLNAPWAVLPDSLREMQQIYATHLKGEKIDLAAVEARLGRPLANDQQGYDLRPGGVAVLSVEGVIAPKANLFTQISGGTSAQLVIKQLGTAALDSRVNALVQAVDSPGGSVFGTPEWAQAVRRFAAVKPIVTVSEATIASAAYWGGAAANAVYLSGPTAQAGSIGVYARMGLSEANPGAVEFVRGKYKRSAINGEKPSDEYLAYQNAQLDHLYGVFVETVATDRGTTVAQVLEHMADGRVFIGQQAIDAGLVDGFATVDAMVEQLATNPAKFAKRRKAVFALGGLPVSAKPAGAQADAIPTEPVLLDNSNPKTEKESTMDRATLELQHPALFAQLQSEFTATATAAATATATAAGAAAERQRIADVRAQFLTGHEALIETLAADGKTTGPEAAMAVLAVERTRASGAAAAHFADAPPAASHAAAPSDAKKTPAVQAAEATALAKSKGISVVAALKELGFA